MRDDGDIITNFEEICKFLLLNFRRGVEGIWLTVELKNHVLQGFNIPGR